MSCAQCTDDSEFGKTLYDKTIAGRLSTASRRTKRTLASAAVLGLLACGSAASFGPASAAPDFTGFTTHAQATPLRIEVHEPAVPVPSDPQLEFNFSYTKVDASSGPIGTARASALWPGDAIGEGLKTFGEQLGLPGALTDGGYPVQANAQTPGDVASQTQEFLPGNTGKAITNDKQAVAKVGYGTTGDVAQGDLGDGSSSSGGLDLLGLLKDPTQLTGILTGTKSGKPGDPTPSGSPLGALGALVNVSGMDSISTTNYDPDADAVVATATSRLGTIGLLGGLVKLDGVEVTVRTTSNIAGGAKIDKDVNIGGMSILGQGFKFTGTGVVAAGSTTPIPGLPDAPAAALKALGISLDLGKVTETKNGPAGSITAEGLRLTIDTAPLLSLLPKLPLAELVSQLPDLPGQASILKGLIIALGDAHPRIDLVLGQSTASAQTVAGFDDGGSSSGGGTDVNPPSTDDGGGTGTLPDTSIDAGAPPGDVTPTTPVEVSNNGISPANNLLPKMGSVPFALTVGGFLLAGGLGWYIWRGGAVLFGGANSCAHGLKAGIPDLRKV